MNVPYLKAQVQELRTWLAQKDHSLAQEAALATSRPFPDEARPGQGCKCVFGPRCESNRCCEDEGQAVGIKDPRTGTIRARARWSFFHPWWSRGPAPRIVFYCDACLEELRAVWGKPISGITRPAHASDFWQPSISEHVRLARIKNEHDEKMREASEAMKFAAFSEKPMTARERAMTPERWKQTLFIRQKFREHARRDGAGS